MSPATLLPQLEKGGIRARQGGLWSHCAYPIRGHFTEVYMFLEKELIHESKGLRVRHEPPEDGVLNIKVINVLQHNTQRVASQEFGVQVTRAQ